MIGGVLLQGNKFQLLMIQYFFDAGFFYLFPLIFYQEGARDDLRPEAIFVREICLIHHFNIKKYAFTSADNNRIEILQLNLIARLSDLS